MHYNNYNSRRPHWLLASLAGVCTILAAACSSQNVSNPALPSVTQSQVRPATSPQPSPTPYPFDFQTVDDTKGETFTKLSGIDDLSQVVGSTDNTYGTIGFTSLVPYDSFLNFRYPNATMTVATAINPGGLNYGGYAVLSSTGDTVGWVKNKGVWTTIQDPKAPKGNGSTNEILGVNDNMLSVGFYLDGKGHSHAFEYSAGRYVALNPPGAVSAVASAINLHGTIAGYETFSDGTTEGWIMKNSTFIPFAYPKAKTTIVNGLSDAIFNSDIVGSYVDGNGNTHGFVVQNIFSQPVWQSIDEPNAVGTTVVTGMNNHTDLSGWYVDGNGTTHGFIAYLKGSKP